MRARRADLPADLARLTELWPDLPAAIRAALVQMAEAAKTIGGGQP